MQVNNINQQTNFGNAYAKLEGKLYDLAVEGGEVTAEALRKIYTAAKTKKGLLLDAEDCLFESRGSASRGSVKDLRIVLTDSEANFFDYLKDTSSKKKQLNDLFRRNIKNPIKIIFHQDLAVFPAGGIEFIA